MQQQWRIPNNEAHADLIGALCAVCNPHKCGRIARIPAMKIEIFGFNSRPNIQRVSDSVFGNRQGIADNLTREIYRDLQGRNSAIIIREGDESLVLSVNNALDAYNEIFEQARGTQDAIIDLALQMAPVLDPLEAAAA